MRGSDPDAAVFYLAKMLYAGEDVKFIARRIMICASEDVGNADPMAISVAVAAAQAVERVGMPEAQIILSQAVLYVATAPKSNSAEMRSWLQMQRCGHIRLQYRVICRMRITKVLQTWEEELDINTRMTIQITM